MNFRKKPRAPRSKSNMVELTLRVPVDKAEALRSYAARLSKTKTPISRQDVAEKLHAHRALFERYGVRAAWLFGSVVRNEAKPLSDVDIMVEFHPGQPGGLLRYVELKQQLEGILGRSVDLITRGNIRPRLQERIEAECVLMFTDQDWHP